jgi:3-hydroxy-3-methylglutaryl CoA synthase
MIVSRKIWVTILYNETTSNPADSDFVVWHLPDTGLATKAANAPGTEGA